MLYSVRMRAAQEGANEVGGRHISGAERLVRQEEIQKIAGEMIGRALAHSRGQADNITIKVESIPLSHIATAPLLPVRTVDVSNVAAGRQAALAQLVRVGVNPVAAEIGLARLVALSDSMAGAMILCAATGERLDNYAHKGIRVSRMDIEDSPQYERQLADRGLTNIHVREALVLASKVAAAPKMIAELCWSDDPDYTAGYVASPAEYCRFPHLKTYGSPVGGRVFFINPSSDLAALIEYLRYQPVLVTLGER